MQLARGQIASIACIPALAEADGRFASVTVMAARLIEGGFYEG
jgi:hypothetical protein